MLPAIQTPEDFDNALELARQRLEGLPTANAADSESFFDLLRRIADYHDRNPTVRTDRVQDEMRVFDDHLKSYGRHWPSPGERPSDHWAPMLGGSVRPG